MGSNLPKLRAGAVQASSILFDLEGNIEKACKLIREAAAQGARLLVFPECFLPGYPIWLDFYVATSKKSRLCYQKLFLSSVEIPSREFNRVCDAAKETHTIVVMGVCERRSKTTGTLYNSQVFVSNQGKILGVHRKLVPTLKERMVHSQGFGPMLQVYDTEFGGIGGLICGENSNPLAKFSLMVQGEVIHAASWPPYFSRKPMSETIGFVSRALAYENKVFVINAAGFLDQDNLSAIDATMDTLSGNISPVRGGSSIVAPSGEIVAGPLLDKEGVLYFEMDLNEIVLEKMVHDFAGHYNRFDVFSLRVNNDTKPSIEVDTPAGLDRVEEEGRTEEK